MAAPLAPSGALHVIQTFVRWSISSNRNAYVPAYATRNLLTATKTITGEYGSERFEVTLLPNGLWRP